MFGEFGEHSDFDVRRLRIHHVRGDRDLRKFGAEAGDVLLRGIVGIAEAEEDFEFRIVLDGMGTNGGVEFGIAAADWFQNRERRQTLPGGSRSKASAPFHRGNQDQEIVSRGCKSRESREPGHSETKATPQTTSAAPAHRSQFTRSWRM